ncbi:MAG: hypothetical protein JW821_14005 [Deltaproteobacteria bacterium]|nr:hypothetical protein [Deltaproteobacteria bacterium]
MKRKAQRDLLSILVAVTALATLLLLCPDALAEEGTSPGRKIWDNVMLFVNFGILVFLFLKFGRKPLMGFLRGFGKKIGDELDTINGRIEEAKTSMEDEAQKMQGIDQVVEEIRQGIIEIGKKERDQIIAQGKSAAEKMIQDAEAYAQYRIEVARKALVHELVEMAVSIAEERMVKGISQEEQQTFVDRFLADMETTESRERFRRKY